MNRMQFSIEIKASKEIVWDVLWRDETFRKWAGVIDPGTHLVGDLRQANEVQFISANSYGVTSLVETYLPNEYILFRHKADTKQNGSEQREDQWTGGEESYSLSEVNGATTLSAAFDVPSEMKDYFSTTYPKALDLIKDMAEKVL